MADDDKDKKLKLANTRKRFKELQELKRKKNESANLTQETNKVHTDGGQLAASKQSQNVEIPSNDLSCAQTDSSENLPDHSSNQENVSPGNVPTYFDNKVVGTNYGPADFFDNISVPNVNEDKRDSPSVLTYFNTENDSERDDQHIGLPKYFDNTLPGLENTIAEGIRSNYTLFPQESADQDLLMANLANTVCQDDPEIKQNEIAEYQVGPSGDAQVPELFNKNPNDSHTILDYLDNSATVEEKRESNEIKNEISLNTDIARQEIQHSNVENLRQISDQLAQMIEPSYEFSATGSITDLEKRNLELAANLERERMYSQQLHAANEQYQLRISELESRIKDRESSSELEVEIARLKSELQAHFQTIGLLVAEKTELSANLSQYELNYKQKTAECEESQARLKVSRSRVSDLERELNILKSEKIKFENMGGEYSEHLVKLKEEYKALKEQKDELTQDLLEAQERLKQSLEENLSLQQQNKELSGKLSLAEIKIQQLTVGDQTGSNNHIEELTQQKFALENEVANLNQMLKSIIKERDESTSQYQQYAQQLNAQLSNLSEKLEQLQQEKESLLIQEQNRIKHMSELERQLQSLQDNQIFYATRNANSDLKSELEKSRETCVQLQIEKTKAEENYTKVSNEKELLLNELEAKNDSISQLESMVEQLRGNQPDSVKLLATMESDKVAAARAVQQNKELKQQMDSMQEVFMKLDNDKVELTERLSSEQQTNKDLMEKLQKTELHLQTLADAIEIKDRELVHLRDASESFSRHSLQYQQLEDRLRHYEAHDHSSHTLQQELQEAKHTIVKLTNEINKLKNEFSAKSEQEHEIEELTNDIGEIKVEEQVESKQSDPNQNMLDKENAMKYLEEKVKRTMQEIANLTDEKQRLEHIVLQLQGETETIGEYVALYQHQRMVLKQKALEKDQQLKQLAQDREQIKVKLDRLNQLIKKLVVEKGAIPAELIRHQEEMKNQVGVLCDEHSKINEEIDRITVNNVDQSENRTTQTAEEIISLLSEIKTSNLVQPDENFHHCPWCSGQLITV